MFSLIMCGFCIFLQSKCRANKDKEDAVTFADDVPLVAVGPRKKSQVVVHQQDKTKRACSVPKKESISHQSRFVFDSQERNHSVLTNKKKKLRQKDFEKQTISQKLRVSQKLRLKATRFSDFLNCSYTFKLGKYVVNNTKPDAIAVQIDPTLAFTRKEEQRHRIIHTFLIVVWVWAIPLTTVAVKGVDCVSSFMYVHHDLLEHCIFVWLT